MCHLDCAARVRRTDAAMGERLHLKSSCSSQERSLRLKTCLHESASSAQTNRCLLHPKRRADTELQRGAKLLTAFKSLRGNGKFPKL